MLCVISCRVVEISCGLMFICIIFFFKQKTAYEMRISDWSSDVCSSDLIDDKASLGIPRFAPGGVPVAITSPACESMSWLVHERAFVWRKSLCKYCFFAWSHCPHLVTDPMSSDCYPSITSHVAEDQTHT